jgi:hypothetical protein
LTSVVLFSLRFSIMYFLSFFSQLEVKIITEKYEPGFAFYCVHFLAQM